VGPGSRYSIDIPNDIGEFLSDKQEQFEFIHMSHVIEHVPKYSLLWVVDSLCIGLCGAAVPCCCARQTWKVRARIRRCTSPGARVRIRRSNLMSLLDICGFDDVRLLTFREQSPSLKQRAGNLLRWPILKLSQIRHRLFGVNQGAQFGSELIVIGKRGAFPPYFDRRFK